MKKTFIIIAYEFANYATLTLIDLKMYLWTTNQGFYLDSFTGLFFSCIFAGRFNCFVWHNKVILDRFNYSELTKWKSKTLPIQKKYKKNKHLFLWVIKICSQLFVFCLNKQLISKKCIFCTSIIIFMSIRWHKMI